MVAFLAGAADFFAAAFLLDGAFFVEGAFFAAGAALLARVGSSRWPWSDVTVGPIASSATRRGGSSPASTKERTSPFFKTWRALVGGGVPMAVSGM